MIAFGPVPSRRLGRSLGINNIPSKVCSYSCAYRQVGRTSEMRVERSPFYPPQKILNDVEDKVKLSRELGLGIDYLTFVPDGEPTLDANLGQEIRMLKPLGIKTAVISNSSLIWDREVREELSDADWISLKVDAVDERAWRRINRPHRALRLQEILEGILEFAQNYKGQLATETMLVKDVNDDPRSLQKIADFLAQVQPSKAYIAVSTRPPAVEWVRPPSEGSINLAYQIFCERPEQVELLVGYEGDLFALTGDVEQDLLSITAVHPMREEAVRKFLEQAGIGWDAAQRLIDVGQLVEADYNGHRFYLRRPMVPKK